ncbi:UNVERIFIED_CONTAM: hypothetical protein Slati_0344600 [Sesamum latifolium]|uniref:Uncharacterized protein n=1 Tax=Sesamum latifolium TaxID=2727402 RepID=A0AAW2YFL5_9LAMI
MHSVEELGVWCWKNELHSPPKRTLGGEHVRLHGQLSNERCMGFNMLNEKCLKRAVLGILISWQKKLNDVQNLQGLPTQQMLGLVIGTLHRQFIEKDIKTFEEFHMAILDTFSTVNAALPGKHYDAPSPKEVEKKVNLSKLDDTTLITGILTPPAAMAAKSQ